MDSLWERKTKKDKLTNVSCALQKLPCVLEKTLLLFFTLNVPLGTP